VPRFRRPRQIVIYTKNNRKDSFMTKRKYGKIITFFQWDWKFNCDIAGWCQEFYERIFEECLILAKRTHKFENDDVTVDIFYDNYDAVSNQVQAFPLINIMVNSDEVAVAECFIDYLVDCVKTFFPNERYKNEVGWWSKKATNEKERKWFIKASERGYVRDSITIETTGEKDFIKVKTNAQSPQHHIYRLEHKHHMELHNGEWRNAI
jgi:hypothetical protein